MMYNIILELRKEMDEVKKITVDLLSGKSNITNSIPDLYQTKLKPDNKFINISEKEDYDNDFFEDIDESPVLNSTLSEQEIFMIKNSLQKFKNKRKLAAKELGISERTLYRKIKEYNL